MSVFQHPCYAAEIPLMSSCSELVVTEFSSSRIKSLRELLFQKERLVIEGVGFSPFRRLVCEIARTSHGLKPSFYELDLCVRALLLDENVGYVPPFIVLFETGKDGKARTLFTRASHVPSPWILDSLPKTCGSSTCTDSDCIGLWRNEESQSLHHPSAMVWDVQRPDYHVVCNLWGCEVEMQVDPTIGQMTLQRC